MKGALEYLQGWSDLAICCRLIIAPFLGSMIGWERISKRHNAGIRTFALVSLGAAVSTALNIKLGYIPSSMEIVVEIILVIEETAEVL